MSKSPQQPDASDSAGGSRFSFLALAVAALVVGVLFFQVIRPFLLPLFFAAMFALLFRPVYLWIARRMRGWNRLAGAVATLLVFLVILAPVSAALYFGGRQLIHAATELVPAITGTGGKSNTGVDSSSGGQSPEDSSSAENGGRPKAEQVISDGWQYLTSSLSNSQRNELEDMLAREARDLAQSIFDRTRSLAANLIGFLIGCGVMLVSLYFFFVEGPQFLEKLATLSPLKNEEMYALYQEFDEVCRGVVLGTLASAVVQALLAGLGFLVAGVDNALLLTLATLFCSLIPFVGSSPIYLTVSLVLFLGGDHWTAVGLALYGLAIVSTSDNLVRAYAVHGSAGLHPLVVFITMLGALQVIGLWGLFAGPIIAGFLYALLKILHQQVQQRTAGGPEESSGENRET